VLLTLEAVVQVDRQQLLRVAVVLAVVATVVQQMVQMELQTQEAVEVVRVQQVAHLLQATVDQA
jgi:hypothetical protein